MSVRKEELLKKAKQGDCNAFEELFEGLRRTAYSVAMRVVGPNDAEDVVMEAFLKAWQTLPGFEGRASIESWLYRITYNCSMDLLRKKRRRMEEPLSEDQDYHKENTADVLTLGPDETAVRNELVQEVNEALMTLPEQHQSVLLFRYRDGMSYSEIATATGVSIGTVMSRIFYAKRQLNKSLRKQTP
ncbi:MAG: sigma-70 family RNA polymerase sigma factor [Lentisphaerae bacterium]|nr:sigma-70 family RNA polymerase sigma factor [Lentisphaerota bacterium]